MDAWKALTFVETEAAPVQFLCEPRRSRPRQFEDNYWSRFCARRATHCQNALMMCKRQIRAYHYYENYAQSSETMTAPFPSAVHVPRQSRQTSLGDDNEITVRCNYYSINNYYSNKQCSFF